MKKRAEIQTSEDLVRAFGEFFDELEPETAESIDAELRDAGYDPGEVGARMKAIAERAITESPLNWRKRARGELEEARDGLRDSPPTSPRDRGNIVESIKQLLLQLGDRARPAPAYFRNLESLSDEDLVGMLDELEYLLGKDGNSADREIET